MAGFSSIVIDADIHTLYSSDFYRVVDFRCRCKDCRESKPEYGEAFCISFVRKGNFLFNVFRRHLDSYTGCVLISKPEYERTITHTHAVLPFHFSRLFKTFTNSSPHRYLLSIRLRHAAMLLSSSDSPMADIAFASGFNGVEHFTAAFRNKYKCPPSRWRVSRENSKIS